MWSNNQIGENYQCVSTSINFNFDQSKNTNTDRKLKNS